MNRREFLGVTSLGVLGVGLSFGNVSVSEEQKKKGSVIYITLGGGASHVEFFNPAPDAPSEYRSVTGNIYTNTPGLHFGSLMPNLAKMSDQFTVVKSFTHRDFNHASATHLVQTGKYNTRTPDTQTWPSYGSVVSEQLGAVGKTGLPSYIKLNKTDHDGAAWLGLDHSGFNASKEGLGDMIMKVSEERFLRREQMLSEIDKSGNIRDPWLKLRDQAVGVLMGDASKIFNITKDTMYNDYKDSQFGKDLLTARRLVQGGAAFVKVSNPGWDMHSNIESGLKSKQGEIDKYLAILISDLENKGLNEDVLVVFTTEFGRTPKINPQSGRDHWAKVCNLMLYGGRYNGGFIGEVDRTSSEVVSEPVTPADLCKTVLDHCGIADNAHTIDNLQRPRMFVEDTAKIIGV